MSQREITHPFIYPGDLHAEISKRWKIKQWPSEEIPPLPPRKILTRILETAYHASFVTEEQRRLTFRIIYLDPRAGDNGLATLPPRTANAVFSPPRPLTVSELQRLIPAAEPTQVLIGVWAPGEKEENLHIWGFFDSGTSWWDFIRHEDTNIGGGLPPPSSLVVSSNSPGQIKVLRGGDEIVALELGEVSDEISNVFFNGPIHDFFQRGATALYDDSVNKLGIKQWDSDGDDSDYPRHAYMYFLQRLLNRIREMFHGGTLLIVPDYITAEDSRLTDRIKLKYTCSYSQAWDGLINELEAHRHYYNQYFSEQVKDKRNGPAPSWDFKLDLAKEQKRNAAGFLAGLSGVDGAVVITDQFRLIGFGGEITASSPQLTSVKVRTGRGEVNPETSARDIESFGTRHRSAMRFCSSFEDSVCFVISSDGDARAIKRVGPDVVLWPNIRLTF